MNAKSIRHVLYAFLPALAMSTAPQRTGAESVFPGKAWEETTPESQGVDTAKMNEALAQLKAITGPDGISQTMLIRHGRVIWQGEHTDSWHNVYSCTKSFTSITVGLLIEDGVLTPDTSLADFAPELKEFYPDLSVRHCLSLTAGYTSTDSNYPFTPAPPLFKDGEAMRYGGEALNMMSYAVTRAAGEPLIRIFKKRIANPIGIDRKWTWGDYGLVNGVQVNNTSGSVFKGIHTTARNMARVGLLLLNRGKWDGKQLVPEGWIEQASKPQSPSNLPLHDPNGWYKTIQGAYGFGFWVNGVRADGKRLWPDAPPHTFAMQGNMNNICFIIPEWDMVLVRLGTDGVTDAEDYTGVFKLLKAAIQTP